jgi:hypothetical protein
MFSSFFYKFRQPVVVKTKIIKSSSCPARLESLCNKRLSKVSSEQSLDSLIEETTELVHHDDNLKLFLLFIFNTILIFKRKMSVTMYEIKIKEITTKLLVHYFLHQLFCYIESNNFLGF